MRVLSSRAFLGCQFQNPQNPQNLTIGSRFSANQLIDLSGYQVIDHAHAHRRGRETRFGAAAPFRAGPEQDAGSAAPRTTAVAAVATEAGAAGEGERHAAAASGEGEGEGETSSNRASQQLQESWQRHAHVHRHAQAQAQDQQQQAEDQELLRDQLSFDSDAYLDALLDDALPPVIWRMSQLEFV